MPKDEWGVKRLCPSCSTRFYDLQHDPMTCPSCGATFTVDSLTAVKAKALRPEKLKPEPADIEDLPEIEADLLRRHRDAFTDPAPKLADLGFIRYRKDGEPHAFEPPAVKLLQEAVNSDSREAYQAYRDHVAQHAPTAVRDLLRVLPLGDPVPLDEVTPGRDDPRRVAADQAHVDPLDPVGVLTHRGAQHLQAVREHHDQHRLAVRGAFAEERDDVSGQVVEALVEGHLVTEAGERPFADLRHHCQDTPSQAPKHGPNL